MTEVTFNTAGRTDNIRGSSTSIQASSNKGRKFPTFKVIIIALVLIILAIWAPTLVRLAIQQRPTLDELNSARPVLDLKQAKLNAVGKLAVLKCRETEYSLSSVAGDLMLTLAGKGSIAIEAIQVDADYYYRAGAVQPVLASLEVLDVLCTECQRSTQNDTNRHGPPLSVSLPGDTRLHVGREWPGVLEFPTNDSPWNRLKVQVSGTWTYEGYSESIVLNTEKEIQWTWTWTPT